METEDASAGTEELVASWAKADTAEEILLSLLNDESPNVRCAAATELLKHGRTDEALTVLLEMAGKDDLGLAGSTADSVIAAWEKQNTQ